VQVPGTEDWFWAQGWQVIDEDPGFAAVLDASSLGEPGAVALGSRTTGAQLAEILRRARLAAEGA
jgi:hypothetical protein